MECIRQEQNPEADLDFFCRGGLSLRIYGIFFAKIIYNCKWQSAIAINSFLNYRAEGGEGVLTPPPPPPLNPPLEPSRNLSTL